MKKTRQVNIELLRIAAMLMVLALHVNFKALGRPSPDDIMTVAGLTRTFGEFLCIVAVNVFVMISGWFGIRPSLRGFCNFMWQVVYCVAILLIAGTLFFHEPITLKSLLQLVGLYSGGGWFVASYIGLYILSPVLNAYVEKSSIRKMATMLIPFFLFEFLWGNTLSVGFILAGYSTFSFIGLYILAGFLRKLSLNYGFKTYICVFLAATLINTCCFTVATLIGSGAICDVLFNYINPLVIIGASALLLAFARFTPPYSPIFQHITLWMSASCFAAYLLHTGASCALRVYCDGARLIYCSTQGATTLLLLLAYILGVFILAVIIDQPRRLVWRVVNNKFFNKK